jgi:hypothetical protein
MQVDLFFMISRFILKKSILKQYNGRIISDFKDIRIM